MTADTVGGVWTYALELARALEARGVEIALATMGAPMRPDQRKEVRSIRNVEVFESSYKLEWMEDPWSDVAAAGDWLLELERRLRPDVLHLNGYAHGALPWRAPTVVVGHSCVLSWWRALHGGQAPAEWNVYREAVSAGLRSARLVVAPSQTMLAALVEHYGPLSNTAVIANGRRLPLPEPQPKEQFIFTAGRLWDAAKNVAALNAVAPALPWPVYAAGEAANSGGGEAGSGHVRYLGQLSAEELVSWLARASIFALPARYEPFGLSTLEAALAGCALVLGDVPSLREIWGDAALFVSPAHPESLRQALMELIECPAKVSEFAAKARRTACRYTLEKMAADYLAAYGEAMRNGQRSQPQLLSV